MGSFAFLFLSPCCNLGRSANCGDDGGDLYPPLGSSFALCFGSSAVCFGSGGSHIPFRYHLLGGCHSSGYLSFHKDPNKFMRAKWSSFSSCLFSCFLPSSCKLGIRHSIFRSTAVLFIYGEAPRSSSCRNRFTKPALACRRRFPTFHLSFV